MSNIVYLTVTGEQQGSISAGCGTSESTGNRWQSGHEDETFTFSLLNNINNTGLGSQFHGITFCKLIDKSTPLFINFTWVISSRVGLINRVSRYSSG